MQAGLGRLTVVQANSIARCYAYIQILRVDRALHWHEHFTINTQHCIKCRLAIPDVMHVVYTTSSANSMMKDQYEDFKLGGFNHA